MPRAHYSRAVTLLDKPARVACAVVVLLGGTGASGGAALGQLLAALAVILVAAKLAGVLFMRLRLPPVLGELLAGVMLGNLGHLGVHGLDTLVHGEVVALLAELGVILLLFEVGLESNVSDMLRVGKTATIVAVVGVVVPMGLGAGVARLMLPDATWHEHVFIGAILTATSVGITARVLKDLGAIASAEGRIILGAAVIDDVLGLIVLAVVKGIVVGASTGQGVGALEIAIIVGKAVAFLGGAIVVGGAASRLVFRVAERVYVPGLLLALALAACFGGALAAEAVGLAPIVGAFAVGLVLDRVHTQGVADQEGHGLEELVHPLTAVFVPVFFVVTGAKVDLAVLADGKIVLFGGLLTAAALVGKQACALVAGGGLNRLAIGVGMIPRGEVGLIFASVGAATLMPDGSPTVSPSTYAAVVMMVMITTLVTPPALTWAIKRGGARAS